MNQTFSLTRFARLHRWLWATKGRTYLIGGAAFIVLTLLILSPVLTQPAGFMWGTQRNNVIYFTLLALVLTITIGSDIFSALFRQESAIGYLMIPVSRTEKFWLGALYCLVALVLLGVVFFSYEAVVFSIVNSRPLVNGQERLIPSLMFHTTHPGGDTSGLFILSWALLTSLAASLLGSFFFRRGVFVRNVGAVLASAVSLTLLYHQIVKFQFGRDDVDILFPFWRILVRIGYNLEDISLPAGFVYGLYVVFLIALWIIARLRFNEVER